MALPREQNKSILPDSSFKNAKMCKPIIKTLTQIKTGLTNHFQDTSICIPKPGIHIPILDGVRGLAILLVMMHHFTIYGGMQQIGIIDTLLYKIAYTGWFGVDLFFVLSGFLITGILIDTKGHQHFFRNFYMRRVLRIFPLYYGVLVLFFLVFPTIFPIGSDYRSLLEQQIWYWSYLTNVPIALHGWASNPALDHFWSLAVEEQFYLIWPVVVYFFRRRTFMTICIAAIVCSLGIRLAFGLAGYRLAAYVMMPARMDALALGALLALVVRRPDTHLSLSRWAWPVAAITSMAILALFIQKQRLSPGDGRVYTIGFSLLAVLFGALLIISLTSPSNTGIGKFFAHPILRFFGRYSYALYVFHHPIIFYLPRYGFSVQSFPTLMGSQLPGLILFSAVATLISVVLALISWYLLESRFLALKRFFKYGFARQEKASPLIMAPDSERLIGR